MIDLLKLETNLASQYKGSNLDFILQDIAKLIQQEQSDIISQYTTIFSIDTATDIWLDFVGYRLGIIERPALVNEPTEFFGFEDSGGTGFDQFNFVSTSEDKIPLLDKDFRPFLKAIALGRISNGTAIDIRNSLLQYFEEIEIIDNFDMTMVINITTAKQSDEAQAVIDAGIIFKPAGVGLVYNLIPI